jgi:hypothetical protein
MNIESKAYKVSTVAILPGQVEIKHRKSGRCYYIPAVPALSVNALAAMHERDFDALCADLTGA